MPELGRTFVQAESELGAIGALLTALPEITVKDVEKALEAHLPARHKHLLPKNYEALRRGLEAAQRVLA